ncbi:MAG: maleylpyruvate isomerase family mycothiol-dependent enzyme [Actinomycetota bacterium]
MTLPVARYVSAILEEFDALAQAAALDLTVRVPSCPDWTTADLVYHVGDVYWSWRATVEGRRTESSTGEFAPRPADAELVDWAIQEAQQLAHLLANTDPHTRVWTWAPQKDVAFVQRRMAQETAVHRVDAEIAAGFRRPIPSDLAADGVDEFLEFFLPDEPERLAGTGESVHLHATDSGDEWLVTVRDGAVTFEHEHAKGDAAVRAPVSDLLLLLWRRVPIGDVEVLGDRAALDRFLARTSLT